ncbi:TPA: SDR family oxidoreductase [Bacillus cereus]|uniref:Short chain dehydrogenase family protein n=2 Tax=Bacillus cereus TaxID=1396 RepID=A0AAN0SZ31_BACCE|nr:MULTISPECIES: SDR family oxidoreductase [Bacillus cereus group]ACO26429.1 oxidoreductase, short chain dehydrogenase family [Bacillus cereus 03BB102]AEW54410.1 putative oxidoreductase [Bacillus cereus F837/76]AJG56355.1 short chain dehydrogenase family protein [Bacillus cereus 03BB102]AJH68611.1 short chain dehydrogenase family protein [Bacillus thuringiensis]AJI13120.1 short chain dehydrogenase family protein [Bacillus cereus 03BB108]
MSGNILILGADGYIGKDLQTVIDDTKNIYCIDKTYKEKVMKETNKVYFNLDVSQEEDIRFLSNYFEENNITIDGIINLIGVNTLSNFYNVTNEAWDKTFDINIKSFVFLLKSIYSSLSHRVSIVSVASQNGIVAHEDRIAYGTSKAALIHLTKNLSIDFLKDQQRDIKVNCVSPSYIINDNNESYLKSFEGNKLLKKIPYRKFVEISDVTNIILFLMSDKSDAIRGQNIVVDYGYTIV